MNVVTPTILSEGKELNSTYEIVSIEIIRDVNRIPYAQLLLLDGDVARQTFAISNEPTLEPGKAIEIKLRYEGETDDVTVFKGIVVKHGVSASARRSLLTIELKDSAMRTTLVRKSVIYREQKDDAVVRQIIDDNGLTQGKIAAAEVEHGELVQYNCTDWDFLLSRAEANGWLTTVHDGVISTSQLSLTGEAVYTFEYGIDEIYDFEIEADAEDQLSGVESVAWNIAAQTLTKVAKGEDFSLRQGNLKGKTIAQALGQKQPQQLTSIVPLTTDETKEWADGRLMRSRLSLIRGRIATRGLGEIAVLDLIEVAGIGDRFNGVTAVTGIRHRVDVHGWQTDVQFGLAAEQFAERRDLVEAPAAGLLPAVNGLQIGLVDAFEADPAEELRVKVLLPGLDPEAGSVWARLAAPEAGAGRGYFFRPEPGDEVVIGFLNDDPRQAVVLGSLYSSANPVPETMSELSAENVDKGIVTRTGTTLQFMDGDQGALLIQTPLANQILLSDEEEGILLSDQHGNQVKLSADGIEIVSASDLKIEAGGKVEIIGQQVDVK